MRKNVMILTTGLSGSSPLAGLITRAGYWAGDRTFKKKDYDTYENQELIELNQKILHESEFRGKYEMEFSAEAIRRIAESASTLNGSAYREFVQRCDDNGPWIWKDPRLWLTIRVWRHHLDLDRVQFVVIHRNPLQSWISTTIRRQIQTYEYSRRYTDQVYGSITEFLEEARQPRLDIEFEDLVMKPESVMERLNGYLGTSLDMDDVRAVYTKPLRQMPRGKRDLVKAVLIFAKNYGSRYR